MMIKTYRAAPGRYHPAFPGKATLDQLKDGLTIHDPNETFEDHLVLVDGPRRVELLWAPS